MLYYLCDRYIGINRIYKRPRKEIPGQRQCIYHTLAGLLMWLEDEMRICSVDGCVRKHESRGLCKMHYKRLMRNGNIHYDFFKRDIGERLEDNIMPIPESGCWIWTGATTSNGKNGYGQISIRNRNCLAHRVSYEHYIGEIPEGMLALHKCDTPLCINPNHIFIGNFQDNTRDASLKGRMGNGPSDMLKEINELKEKIKYLEGQHG